MSGDGHVLDRLFAVIEARRGAEASTSYTAKLFAKGRGHIAKKLGEETAETIIAAVSEPRDRIAAESADLLYHLLVLWAAAGVTPESVWAELAKREGTSGLTEKAARRKGEAEPG